MTIFQIECFVTLSKYLNFTKAASIMNITQPAFSRLISSMEGELDAILFDRTSRSVNLTKAGQVFLEEANIILKHYYNSLSKVKFYDKRTNGMIKIGMLKEQLNNTLSTVISSFRKDYPNINLVLNEYSHSNIIQALETFEIDVAFTISPGISSIANVEWISEMELEISAILPLGHPLCKKENLDITDLNNESFVIFDEDEKLSPHNIVLYLCREYNIKPRISKIVTCINSVMTLVECGEGICLVPFNFQDQFKQEVVYKKISNSDYKIERVFAWIKDNKNPYLPLLANIISKISK